MPSRPLSARGRQRRAVSSKTCCARRQPSCQPPTRPPALPATYQGTPYCVPSAQSIQGPTEHGPDFSQMRPIHSGASSVDAGWKGRRPADSRGQPAPAARDLCLLEPPDHGCETSMFGPPQTAPRPSLAVNPQDNTRVLFSLPSPYMLFNTHLLCASCIIL